MVKVKMSPVLCGLLVLIASIDSVIIPDGLFDSISQPYEKLLEFLSPRYRQFNFEIMFGLVLASGKYYFTLHFLIR